VCRASATIYLQTYLYCYYVLLSSTYLTLSEAVPNSAGNPHLASLNRLQEPSFTRRQDQENGGGKSDSERVSDATPASGLQITADTLSCNVMRFAQRSMSGRCSVKRRRRRCGSLHSLMYSSNLRPNLYQVLRLRGRLVLCTRFDTRSPNN
jgi:hypothetical protein